MEANLSLTELLRVRRHQKKMSQSELADLSGISRNYVSMIERGNYTRVSLYVLGNICNALGLRLKIDAVEKEQEQS